MPQTAIRGICHNGKVILQEEIPFKEDMRVIIVFTERIEPGEERYHTRRWIEAEKQATEAYEAGKIRWAESIDVMFQKIQEQVDDDLIVAEAGEQLE